MRVPASAVWFLLAWLDRHCRRNWTEATCSVSFARLGAPLSEIVYLPIGSTNIVVSLPRAANAVALAGRMGRDKACRGPGLRWQAAGPSRQHDFVTEAIILITADASRDAGEKPRLRADLVDL